MTRLISLGGALAAVSTALDGRPCLVLDKPQRQRPVSGAPTHGTDVAPAKAAAPVPPPAKPRHSS